VIDEHIAVMEALKGVQVDGAVLVTTPQVQQEQKNIGNKKKVIRNDNKQRKTVSTYKKRFS